MAKELSSISRRMALEAQADHEADRDHEVDHDLDQEDRDPEVQEDPEEEVTVDPTPARDLDEHK